MAELPHLLLTEQVFNKHVSCATCYMKCHKGLQIKILDAILEVINTIMLPTRIMRQHCSQQQKKNIQMFKNREAGKFIFV